MRSKEHISIIKGILLEHLSTEGDNLSHQHFDVMADNSNIAGEGKERLLLAAREAEQVRRSSDLGHLLA